MFLKYAKRVLCSCGNNGLRLLASHNIFLEGKIEMLFLKCYRVTEIKCLEGKVFILQI